MNKLVGITVNGTYVECQVDDSITIVTSENIDDTKMNWGTVELEPMSWNVNLNAEAMDMSNSLKEMKHKTVLMAEFDYNGEKYEKEVKKYGTRMVRKILRDKRFSRPVIFYEEEFYCNF